MKHSDITSGFIHTPFNWIYTTAADRTSAVGFQTADVNKTAVDLDTGEIWLLKAVDGSGNATWQPLASSLFELPVRSPVVSSGTAVAGAHGPVDATSANLSRALPTGQPAGTLISIEKTDSSTHTVSITGSIRGVGAQTLTLQLQHEQVMFITDGSGSWWPIAGHKTLASLDGRYVHQDGTGLSPAVVRMVSGTAPLVDPATVEVDGNVLYFDAGSGEIKGKVVSGAGLLTTPNTWSALQTFADIALAGKTGATAAVNLAGATASGAPVTGTFVTGDVILSLADGKWYVCTVGGSPGTWVTPGASTTGLYKALILATAGLVSYWRLDETSGTAAADQEATNAGVYSGGFTLAQPGALADGDKGVVLNGTTGFVSVADSASARLVPPFTLEMWMKIAAIPTFGGLICKTDVGAHRDIEWLIGDGSGGASHGKQSLGVGGTTGAASSSDVLTGVYNHLAVTHDGTTARYYLNGKADGAVALSNAGSTSTQLMRFGCRNADLFINGSIDEVAIYNVVLSAPQIAAHFAYGGLA